jgi:cysteinyl-tRNA synthetase
MASKYLGETFDIHAGGEDLIFPHHENEIAQSEGSTGKPLARYWLHNGFVNVNGEKMAKSLGNFVTIRDALNRHSPEALKLLLLSTNYRGPLDYSDAAVVEKSKALAGLQDFLRAVHSFGAEVPEGTPHGTATPRESGGGPHPAEAAFRAAMDEDFNTARASGVLFELVREGNRLLHGAERMGSPAASTLSILRELAALLRRLGEVLSLDLQAGGRVIRAIGAVRLDRPVEGVLLELAALARGEGPWSESLTDRLTAVVQELLAHREAARRRKAWAAADSIRQALTASGFRLEDTKTATHAVSRVGDGPGRPTIAVTLVKE